jgi:hypothetical protein
MAEARATGRAPMGEGDHHTAFNAALKEALKDMDGKFEPGSHKVSVTQELEVDVNSPGIVGWVKVILTPSP